MRHALWLKSFSSNVIKLSLAGGLLYWMWNSDRLDLTKVKVLLTDPNLLVLSCSIWALTQVLGAYRWKTILSGLGYTISNLRALQLHLTGLFFNTAMPGAVGGDLVKAAYVIMENRSLGKSPAMTSIVMDRILGLFGLFSLGLLIMVLDIPQVINSTFLQPIALAVFMLTLGTGIFLLLISKKYNHQDPFLKLISKNYPGSRFVQKIYLTFRLFKDNPRSLIAAWLISVFMQGCYLLYFYLLTEKILGTPINFTQIAMIFPIGILVTALPIAPGGLGVGHVAFDQLFTTVGLTSGATVFNVYVLGFLVLNLTGVLGYVSLKKKKQVEVVFDGLEKSASN